MSWQRFGFLFFAVSLGLRAHADDIFLYLDAIGAKPKWEEVPRPASGIKGFAQKFFNSVPTDKREIPLDKQIEEAMNKSNTLGERREIRIFSFQTNDSRSLQKKRKLYMFQEFPKGDGLIQQTPASFVSFSPDSKLLEVMSWNRRNGDYDFYIVDMNQNDSYREKAVLQQSCVTCHQHGGAILTSVPWNEFSSNSPMLAVDEIIRRSSEILQAQKVCRHLQSADPTFLERALKYKYLIAKSHLHKGDDSFLVPLIMSRFQIPKGSDVVVRDSVRRGLSDDQAQLKFDQEIREVGATDLLKSLQDTFRKFRPKGNFSYHSDVLPDRDMQHPKKLALKVEDAKGVDFTYSTLPIDEDFDTYSKKSQRLGNGPAGKQLLSLNVEGRGVLGRFFESHFSEADSAVVADPKTLRPLVNGIEEEEFPFWLSLHINACLGIYSSEVATDLLKAIDEKGGIEKVLDNAERAGFFTDMNQEKRVPLEKEWLSMVTGSYLRSAPMHSPEANFPHKKENVFEQNCVQCHSATEPLPLPLDDLEALKRYKSEDGLSVIDLIREGTMPPARKGKLPSEVKQQMESELK